MLKLITLRSLSAISSLCLLLLLANITSAEFSDGVYTDIALLMANTILLTFGFDKKIWSVKTNEQGVKIYNVWFQFISYVFIPFLLYSIWSENTLIGISSLILSFIFMISWELQSKNEKYISTILFTMSVPFSYLLSLIIVYLFNLEIELYRYFSAVIFLIILIYAFRKSKLLKLSHKLIRLDLISIYHEIKESSFLVIPAYLGAYSIFLLLDKSAIQLPGTAFEYSGLIRLMAGINIITFAINRFTLNTVKNSHWSKVFKNIPYLILCSLLYGGVILFFSEYINQILSIQISSIWIISLILTNIIISYILTQLIFWCVSEKLFKELAISSVLGSVVIIIMLNIFVVDLLMLVSLVLLGNVIRFLTTLFLIRK